MTKLMNILRMNLASCCCFDWCCTTKRNYLYCVLIFGQMAHNGNAFEYSAMQNVWYSNSDGKVRNKSTWNQLQEQLQEHSFMIFYQLFHWTVGVSLTESSLRQLFRPLNLWVTLLLLLQRKVFTSNFFWCAFPFELELKILMTFKRIFTKIECFSRDTLKFAKRQVL